MPRASAPQWRQRKEPITDEHLQKSIDGKADDQDRVIWHGMEILYAGCETRERANEIRQALFRSAYHLKVSVSAEVEKQPDGTYAVRFQAHSKAAAKKYMLERYGSKENFPYNPFGGRK